MSGPEIAVPPTGAVGSAATAEVASKGTEEASAAAGGVPAGELSGNGLFATSAETTSDEGTLETASAMGAAAGALSVAFAGSGTVAGDSAGGTWLAAKDDATESVGAAGRACTGVVRCVSEDGSGEGLGALTASAGLAAPAESAAEGFCPAGGTEDATMLG